MTGSPSAAAVWSSRGFVADDRSDQLLLVLRRQHAFGNDPFLAADFTSDPVLRLILPLLRRHLPNDDVVPRIAADRRVPDEVVYSEFGHPAP